MFPVSPRFVQIPPFSCLLGADEIDIMEKMSYLIYRISGQTLLLMLYS